MSQSVSPAPSRPNDLEPFWMPFTANRQFKAAPRLLARAKGMHYWTPEGRQVLDGTAGLWCVNAGHCHPKIVEAVQRQVATLDFAGTFQMGHPLAFEAASRLTALAPGDLNHVFFCNSGSESVDSALKIALAYHRARGEGQRIRFIGRERAYHGVGFGGISVGGIGANRKPYGAMLGQVDHLPHTLDLGQAFTRGQPERGADLADALERIVALHDASTIAAVIVEPVAGSTGGLMPPKGYLERLKSICDKHGLLLIFDEVITGFGRLGTPFAADYFGVIPDLMCFAKAVNNATVPMGGVFVRDAVFDAMMQGPPDALDLFHGYTYSGHPLAAAAAVATQAVYQEEGLFQHAAALAPLWEEAMHSLKGASPHLIDIRNLGLIAAFEFAARPGAPGKRTFDVFVDSFERGLLTRQTGDILVLSPPLIVEEAHIHQMVDVLRAAFAAAV